MRMIDKDALLSDIERTIEESGCVNHEGEIMDCVRCASEVDAVPVVRGEWIVIRMPAQPDPKEHGIYWLNLQGHGSDLTYCPNCGAKWRTSRENAAILEN